MKYFFLIAVSAVSFVAVKSANAESTGSLHPRTPPHAPGAVTTMQVGSHTYWYTKDGRFLGRDNAGAEAVARYEGQRLDYGEK